MKVTGLKTFLVTPSAKRAGVVGGKNWLFVKVETDEGIEGWGEAYTQLDRDRAIEEHVRELGRYLVGRDPFAIKHFSAIVYDDFSSRRGSMDLYCALSGIEQALWGRRRQEAGRARPPSGLGGRAAAASACTRTAGTPARRAPTSTPRRPPRRSPGASPR